MTTFISVQVQKLKLAGSGCTSSATSIILQSFALVDGTLVTTAMIGDKGFGTLEPGTSKEESISFTGITQNADGTATLTGVTRGLDFVSPYAEVSGNKYSHAGGTIFVVSNTSAFYGNIKTYIDDIAFAGAPDASSTVKGLVEVATQAEIDAGTAAGATSAKLAVGPDQLALSIYATRLPTADEKIGLASLLSPGLIFPYAGSSAPTGWIMCDGSAISRTTYASLFAVVSTTYGVGDGTTTFNLPNLKGRVIVGAGTAATKVVTFASRASNVITVTGLSDKANNEFQTGQAVLYTAASGAMTGLTHNTTYYIIRTGNLTFSLASSLGNAIAGTVISLSSDGTGTQTFTVTLTARTLADTGGEENHGLTVGELAAHVHAVPTDNGTGSDFGASGSNVTAYEKTSGSTGGSGFHNNMQPFLALNYIIKT